MNREEATRAVEVLAASPAAEWIGNRLVGGVLLQKCTRCGAEQTLELPPNIHGPADVPPGFDEELFAWKRGFQVAHEGCVEKEEVISAGGEEVISAGGELIGIQHRGR